MSWHNWLSNPLALLCVAIGSYWLGLHVYQAAKRSPLFHPLLIACLPSLAWLHYFHISIADFRASTSVLHFLLGPATVALALPLYLQWSHVKKHLSPVLLSLLGGLVVSLAATLGIAYLLGAQHQLLLTLVPKSVTTPIALEIIKITGGWGELTAGIVILTGVLGALIAPLVFRLCGIHNVAAQGFAMGLIAHGVGTARAYELNAKMAAYASLGMGLSGLLSAALLPWLGPVLVTWLVA